MLSDANKRKKYDSGMDIEEIENGGFGGGGRLALSLSQRASTQPKYSVCSSAEEHLASRARGVGVAVASPLEVGGVVRQASHREDGAGDRERRASPSASADESD